MEADQLGRLQDILLAAVDLRVVWEVGIVHVPEICTALEEFFARQPTQGGN